jgi:2-keto-4-pentenoate hydratase/2-oxohepta-3-ene-1,7-dioic acid hydratase in catechol pathway
MDVVRCQTGSGPRYGVIHAGVIRLLLQSPYSECLYSGEELPLAEARLLPPCVPSKIVGIGFNYALHSKELGVEIPKEPLIFLKPPSALIGAGETILLPAQSKQVEYEAELGVVIGRKTKNVTAAAALGSVFGCTCINDVTARDLQKSDVQFTRAKGFDTFCPMGPWIRTGLDVTRMRVRSFVNGEPRQDGSTADLIHPVAELIAYVSQVMTLNPGDVIATGTPAGVGILTDGDCVVVEITGLGRLTNSVKEL